MAKPYKGHFGYDKATVSNWEHNLIGVYYCGYPLSNGSLGVVYIGRAVGDDGIKGRLLQHLSEYKWPEVSHFGYVECDTVQEAIDFEVAEIKRINPKHNVHHGN
jgi:hypothetical protein